MFFWYRRQRRAGRSCKESLWPWAWRVLEWRTWPRKKISFRSLYTGTYETRQNSMNVSEAFPALRNAYTHVSHHWVSCNRTKPDLLVLACTFPFASANIISDIQAKMYSKYRAMPTSKRYAIRSCNIILSADPPPWFIERILRCRISYPNEKPSRLFPTFFPLFSSAFVRSCGHVYSGKKFTLDTSISESTTLFLFSVPSVLTNERYFFSLRYFFLLFIKLGESTRNGLNVARMIISGSGFARSRLLGEAIEW